VPYIHAMTLVPKGVTGDWLDGVYWTLAAEMAFYGLVFCAMLTKKITLRHLAWGLTFYSAAFNAVSLLVLSCTTPSDLPYLVILMFRVPCAAFLLNHGCFFALGIWLFISANRELTRLEQFAVVVTLLSGAAEIYYFASFFLTSIPAIADQSALVPIMVWAAAVGLIAWCANRNRRPATAASREAPAYLRTLGLITYPLYLTHNILGTAIIRALVDAGMDATWAVWVQIGIVVLVSWFICAKIEPAIRAAMTQAIAHFGQLPERLPSTKLPRFARGLGLRPSVPAKLIAT
jgi:peptidoglycan/LPS O-acetylase OafA/YrhL